MKKTRHRKIVEIIEKRDVETQEAVSYTHLDVYKRQGQ